MLSSGRAIPPREVHRHVLRLVLEQDARLKLEPEIEIPKRLPVIVLDDKAGIPLDDAPRWRKAEIGHLARSVGSIGPLAVRSGSFEARFIVFVAWEN